MGDRERQVEGGREEKATTLCGPGLRSGIPFIVSFHVPSSYLASDVGTEAWRESASPAGKTRAGVEPKQPLHHFAGSFDDRRELHVVCFFLKLHLKMIVI